MAIAVCAICSGFAFGQTVVNEIMYAPTDAANEWFEIFNGGDAVDIRNWKWKDATSALRTITQQSYILQSGTYIIVCQDSGKFKSLYPQFSGKFFQTAWSALNNTGDNLIVMDQNSVHIDSVTYSSSWGGLSGVSLERKNPSGLSNDPLNWGSCKAASKGTPGLENSIRAKERDVELVRFLSSPLNPVSGGELTLSVTVANTGLNNAENISLMLYDDTDFDSIHSAAELIRTHIIQVISAGDSATVNFALNNYPSGRKQFIAYANYVPDQDTADNVLVRQVLISEPGQTGSIVINEVMYDPNTGFAEWIELYNPSANEIEITGWKLKDNSSTLNMSSSSLTIHPLGFLLIASDSSVYSQFTYLNSGSAQTKVVVLKSLSLNNSGENLVLTDSLGTVIESFSYSPELHNPELEITKGVSLERINPAVPSAYNSNWSSCTESSGGTPCLANSMFAAWIPDKPNIAVSPNPFSPDGDGFEDIALISCEFSFNTGTLRAGVYDSAGRLRRTLAGAEITGKNKLFIFDGYSDERQRLPIGIYIVVVEAIDRINGAPVISKAAIVIAGRL